MFIYLIRHAAAVARSADPAQDAARELTPQGERKMRRNIRGLRRLKPQIDQIWTSPLRRARQTADLLAGAFPNAGEPRTEPALEPGSDPEVFLEHLKNTQTAAGIAAIGHQPDLGELGAWLLTGQRVDALDLKKGGIACIQIDDFEPPVRGRLLWLLTPGQLRRLA